MKQKLDVILLVDLTGPEPVEDYQEFLQSPEWKTENDVYLALKELGHDVRIVGLFDDVTPFLSAVQQKRPDIVFNLAEHFNNNTSYERDVVALVEMLDLPFTGTGPLGLSLCKNKGVMKKLMAYHRIRTPKFSVLYKNKPIVKPKELAYPLIVKPATEDASYGISQASFVENDDALTERVKFVHDNMGQTALIEEYAEGRELYITVLGNDRYKVLSPRELVFKEVPEDEPKIATFKAKWDLEYRKKWGIQNRFANPLADGVMEKISKVCKRISRILHIHGYGRIDMRLGPNNEIIIIEANANPALGKDDEVAQSAEKDGYVFTDLIQKILQMGLARHTK